MFPPSFPENFNAQEWKGIFVQALENVQYQVHPTLIAKSDALEYIESLIISLLGTLCAAQPHTVQDVTDRVNKTFPDPIDKWANRDANIALEKGKKNSSIVLPVEKIHQALIKDVLGYKIEHSVTLYIVAVLEYIAADILKLTGNYVRNIKHTEITYQDIKVAICADQVLMDMFSPEEDVSLPLVEEPIGLRTEAQSYEDIVKDFIFEETQYMRDLSQIIKVFRAPFVKHFPTSKDLEIIFSNILDIYEFTANLLSSVEEQVEVAAENETLTVGISFLDMAEEEEFSVYEKYVDDMLSPRGKERLYTLMQRDDLTRTLEDEGHGFKDAVKYVLPKLLLGPIYHCLHYFEVIKGLTNVSQNEEDLEFLEQANGLLASLRSVLESRIKNGNLPRTKPWETSLRLQGRTGIQQVVQKMSELQKSIDGWEGKDIWQSCSEFILDGVLMKHAKGKPTERHVFLFDGLIILCKPNIKRSSVTYPTGDFKLKEKFHIRKVEIRDKEDTDELKNWFLIVPRDHPNNSVALSAKSPEEKSNWMAALISLQTRSMLERRLDSILKEEERDRPLILPPPETYRFAEKDTTDNIVMEETGSSPTEIPLIKGGTLLKLIERLTYHMYADPKFVKTFLTTFRSFCTPQQLLDLLIERFNIPDPPENLKVDINQDADTNQRIKDDLKKFRKEYIKPVQFRVVNVLRHWVDHHYYDFERDQTLLYKLNTFLKNVKGKAMKKMAESILKVVRRRFESVSTERDIIHAKPAPPIEWHLTKDKEQFDLLTLHPIEIARQVTLLEFDLYRAVQPSELVGCSWMKENKSTSSPNLLKMISFTNNFICWLEKCIIETENYDERVAVVNRTMEIMLVFQELNNFNGVLEIVSAINSASVYRLEHTFDKVSYRKQFEDAKELNADHFKKYIEKLRSINPPCVPFLGMYLTNILLTEEGNPDFLQNRPDIINFSKRRKVAEITGEIQQYQNQPYCLTLEQDIRDFFVNLNPLGNMTEKEFNDHLYAGSLKLEPRGTLRPQKFPKRYDYSLKSPGIKPNSLRASGRGHFFPLLPSGTGYRILNDTEEPEPQSPLQTSPPCSPTDVFEPASPTKPGNSDKSNEPSQLSAIPPLQPPPKTHGDRKNFQSPPPLPPRMKPGRETDPPIPPRNIPPPVPPRHEPQTTHHFRPPSATLPRSSHRSPSQSEFHHVNGNRDLEEGIPKLPPKTYRLTHHTRQKSS